MNCYDGEAPRQALFSSETAPTEARCRSALILAVLVPSCRCSTGTPRRADTAGPSPLGRVAEARRPSRAPRGIRCHWRGGLASGQSPVPLPRQPLAGPVAQPGSASSSVPSSSTGQAQRRRYTEASSRAPGCGHAVGVRVALRPGQERPARLDSGGGTIPDTVPTRGRATARFCAECCANQPHPPQTLFPFSQGFSTRPHSANHSATVAEWSRGAEP